MQACRLKQSDTIGHFNSLGFAIKKIDYCLFNVLNMSHYLCFYGNTGVLFLKFIQALVDKVTSPITELNPWYLHFASNYAINKLSQIVVTVCFFFFLQLVKIELELYFVYQAIF